MPSSAADGFQQFTPEHFALLAGFLVGCVALALTGRSHRGTDRELRFRRTFALLIPGLTIPMQVLAMLSGDISLSTALPLHLSDLAWMMAIIALWTRHWAFTAFTYYWGLTISVQAIVTPSLGQVFPDPAYFTFWAMHFFTVWSAVYLTFGLQVPVTWRSYRLVVATTLIWVVAMMVLNAVLGTNYGYLNGKPSTPSILDVMGPWPFYVLVESIVVSIGWALLTLPWTSAKAPDAAQVGPAGSQVGSDGSQVGSDGQR